MLPKYKKILFATNMGPEAANVFRHALSLAQCYQAKIYVLRVIEPLGSFAQNLVQQYLSKEESDQIQERTRKNVLDEIRKKLDQFCTEETCKIEGQNEVLAEIKIIEGYPSDTIVNYSGQIQADMIVIGTHRHVRVTSMGFIGSTTRQVVNHSHVPVLTVYTPKEKLEPIE